MTALPPSPFVESSTETGGHQEAPAAANMGSVAAGLFDGPDIPLAELIRRGFDVEGFVNDCELLPAFLIDPSPEFLSAREIFPMLRVIAGR